MYYEDSPGKWGRLGQYGVDKLGQVGPVWSGQVGKIGSV